MTINKSIVHRALVTYSNERTGEIRVKVPAVTGNNTEMSISKIGRLKSNDIWIVPNVGEQITVSGDDANFTNLFWLQTDGYVHSKHYRNYFEAMVITNQETTINTATPIVFDTSSTYVYQEGIKVDKTVRSKIYFDYTGVYNLQYSIQWINTATQIFDTVVWVNYNGSPYPYSSTYTSVPSSHGGTPGSGITAVNLIGETKAGAYIQLMWATNDARVHINSSITAGITAGQPVSPGVIATITQVA